MTPSAGACRGSTYKSVHTPHWLWPCGVLMLHGDPLGFCSRVSSFRKPPELPGMQVTALCPSPCLYLCLSSSSSSEPYAYLADGSPGGLYPRSQPHVGSDFIATCWVLVTWTNVKSMEQDLPANLTFIPPLSKSCSLITESSGSQKVKLDCGGCSACLYPWPS